MVVAGGPDPAEKADCPVIKEWLKLDHLVKRATDGKIAHVQQKTLDRVAVHDNHELLLPLVSHFGTSLAVTGKQAEAHNYAAQLFGSIASLGKKNAELY